MIPVKFFRGQQVFSYSDPVKAIYIVLKGSFELNKKLPQEDKRKQAYLQVKKGQSKKKIENIITRKFPDMKDFPVT